MHEAIVSSLKDIAFCDIQRAQKVTTNRQNVCWLVLPFHRSLGKSILKPIQEVLEKWRWGLRSVYGRDFEIRVAFKNNSPNMANALKSQHSWRLERR